MHVLHCHRHKVRQPDARRVRSTRRHTPKERRVLSHLPSFRLVSTSGHAVLMSYVLTSQAKHTALDLAGGAATHAVGGGRAKSNLVPIETSNTPDRLSANLGGQRCSKGGVASVQKAIMSPPILLSSISTTVSLPFPAFIGFVNLIF